jgi:7-cyano-7-deazaguanine synthase in queuosine biosynthesis
LHRELEVTVHVEDPSNWTVLALDQLADLAHWLTGDHWSIRLVSSSISILAAQVQRYPVDRVQLLSGGLDSLCGAIIGIRDGVAIEFVGARDYSNAVGHAQNKIAEALDSIAAYRLERLLLSDGHRRKNHGPRSRALLFVALAVLYAANDGASEVWVPENGFTSINPPLDVGRGGTLTTRSTHPETFRRFNSLLREIGVDVAVVNPYSRITKGELVALAGEELLSDKWIAATSASYSCGRGNTQIFKADPNHNCGLCVACVVRRGSFIGGAIRDPTTYACDELSGSQLDRLVQARSADLFSIRDAVEGGIEDDAVLSSTIWPLGTDFDEVLSLVQRGLAELRAVALPTP